MSALYKSIVQGFKEIGEYKNNQEVVEIADRLLKKISEDEKPLKEEKSDYIGMDDIEFYYIISNGNPRQAIILDASTDQDEIIRMAESSKTYNTVSKYFPDGKGGKEEIVWKR